MKTAMPGRLMNTKRLPVEKRLTYNYQRRLQKSVIRKIKRNKGILFLQDSLFDSPLLIGVLICSDEKYWNITPYI